jgi:acetyl esterase
MSPTPADRLAAGAITAQHHLLRGLLALPGPMKSRLAGAPVVGDNQLLDVDTQLVLRLAKLTRDPDLGEIPVPEGRVRVDGQSRLMAGAQPIGSTTTRHLGEVLARSYLPRALLATTAPLPTLVFLHGGGFIFGGLESHDGVCRVLAERAGVQVIAVDYLLAPEHPFPAAYDDCVAAFAWIVEHARELSVDVDRLAVGGDSAGGNLAIGVTGAAVAAGLPLAAQLLIYPVTDMVNPSVSRDLFSEGFFLTRGFMDLASASYLARLGDPADPRISPGLADVPEGLPPTIVVTAGFDPLRDEGEAYARRLAGAGVRVTLRREEGLIHSFVNWIGVSRAAREATSALADDLAAALA